MLAKTGQHFTEHHKEEVTEGIEGEDEKPEEIKREQEKVKEK